MEVSLAKAEQTAQLAMVNELLKQYVGQARNVISTLSRDQEELDSLTHLIREDELELRKLQSEIQLGKRLDQDESVDDF